MRLIRLLRKVAFWEATFFVILCAAWVVSLTGYRFQGGAALALMVVGFTHGCVFSLYLLLVLLVRSRMRWSIVTTFSILVAGLIPGGGYVVEARALSGARVDALAEVLEGRGHQRGTAPTAPAAPGAPAAPAPSSPVTP